MFGVRAAGNPHVGTSPRMRQRRLNARAAMLTTDRLARRYARAPSSCLLSSAAGTSSSGHAFFFNSSRGGSM